MSTYPNQFARIGISDAAVLSRLSDCFSTIFFSPENNFYHQHPTDPDAACMVTPATTRAHRGHELRHDDVRPNEPQRSL